MPAKQALLIAVALIVMVANGFAQYRSSSPDVGAVVPATGIAPRLLIDCPTAATLPRASFDVHVRDFAGGGLLASINVGLHRRFMLGVSYGGTAVLGEHKPTWQEHPEFEIKYQVVPETYAIPAVAVGFASQGYGPYIDSLDRFTYKSRGFYAVVSKAYQTYEWSTGIHGGINYSLEHTKDHDDSPNIFFGFDMNVNRDVAVVAEYDLALNDNRGDLHGHGGRGRGYFNIGLRWIFMERLELGIDFKNLFNNRKDSNQMSRELRINYYEFF